MREYYLPPDVNKEKEKAVGGVLTFKQTIWLGTGLLLMFGIIAGVITLTQSKFLAIILGLVGGAWTVPMAFFKKMDQPLMGYFFLKIKFLKKTHYLYNKKELEI